MRTVINKIFLVILITTAFTACKEVELEENTAGKYSITLGEFKTYEEANVRKSKLNFQQDDEPKIIQADQNRYILTYGNFHSSLEAGKEAFDLYSKSLIKNYMIAKNNGAVVDLFANVLFVAKYLGRPSVYNYNLITKQSKLLWSRWGRKVLALNHSKDRSIVFITTALGYGKQGSFPYVRDARLYMFSAAIDKIDEITEFGYGLQLYTYWENKDTFKINFTQTDSIKSENLVQRIFSINKSGNIDTVKKRTFTLSKDGFPIPPAKRLELFSSHGTYQLRIVDEDNQNYIYLRDLKKHAEVMIAEIQGKIKNVQWTDDENFLFLIADLKNSKVTGTKDELLIIETKGKRVIRNFTGPEYKNLLVQGNLLFFDQQYEGVSQITIFDFVSGKIFDEIRIPGGCGINDLFF